VSIKFCFKLWKIASYEALETVYGNEAVSCTSVVSTSQDLERDIRILKVIQGVCILQLLKIQKELQRFVNCWLEIVE
jgi:hypothetical protein